ncbi:OB-fold domain-containing protein [Arthrobacter ginkgonis]|uniref:OB-fold domain-containing protein n=1 Tax=Arthrobacter ginkgonis TaxID=1630594 RepID=A0ABP7D888_9MICC
MSYALPAPTPQTRFFWDEAQQRRLVLSYCRDTEQYFFYPRAFSPFTGSANVEWRQASGMATLHSYIINHRPVPGSEILSPVIALVKLAEGPVMMSNIVDVDPLPENLPLDMPLRVDFREADGMLLPVFTPTKER